MIGKAEGNTDSDRMLKKRGEAVHQCAEFVNKVVLPRAERRFVDALLICLLWALKSLTHRSQAIMIEHMAKMGLVLKDGRHGLACSTCSLLCSSTLAFLLGEAGSLRWASPTSQILLRLLMRVKRRLSVSFALVAQRDAEIAALKASQSSA
ncbi:hypothetical protein HAX54_027585 [Datura stramonium]|uniref:Uncharacterized protein n=1 Tax=Datura stramonium TaxID=4076 RepID=A0ABS8V5G3_DATST|nr:hypothetical protein [Datura stramonium]